MAAKASRRTRAVDGGTRSRDNVKDRKARACTNHGHKIPVRMREPWQRRRE